MTNSNTEERYLYTVYPKKPIKNLNESLPLIRVSRSLFLNKEEVLKCFECGSVYRRFSNEGIVEKLSKYDIDRVHRANYISKEEWAKLNEKLNNETLVVNGVAAEEPQPEKQKEKVEEVKEEVINEEVAPEEEDTQENDSKEEDVVYVETPEPAEVVTYGYIEPVEENPQPLPEFTTEAFSDEIVEATDNEEAEDDEIVEDTEVASETIATPEEHQQKPQVTVNYNKKKKHH